MYSIREEMVSWRDMFGASYILEIFGFAEVGSWGSKRLEEGLSLLGHVASRLIRAWQRVSVIGSQAIQFLLTPMFLASAGEGAIRMIRMAP